MHTSSATFITVVSSWIFLGLPLGAEPASTVTISIRDEITASSLLDEATWDIKVTGPDTSVKEAFVLDTTSGGVQGEIPYGYYTVTVSAPGFREEEVMTPIFQQRIHIPVWLQLGQLTPEYPGKVTGTLRCDAVENREYRLSLVSVRPKHGRFERYYDQLIAPDGAYELGRVRRGDYVLLVYRDEVSPRRPLGLVASELLFSRLITVRAKETTEIPELTCP